jgi:hypothetical protein
VPGTCCCCCRRPDNKPTGSSRKLAPEITAEALEGDALATQVGFKTPAYAFTLLVLLLTQLHNLAECASVMQRPVRVRPLAFYPATLLSPIFPLCLQLSAQSCIMCVLAVWQLTPCCYVAAMLLLCHRPWTCSCALSMQTCCRHAQHDYGRAAMLLPYINNAAVTLLLSCPAGCGHLPVHHWR